jgi:hypothetical protein
MKVRLTAEGQTALVVHNERLADPLDTCTQAVAAISKKRNKTIADHEEVARREFLGGLYTTPAIELTDKGALLGNGQVPVIPACKTAPPAKSAAKTSSAASNPSPKTPPSSTTAPPTRQSSGKPGPSRSAKPSASNAPGPSGPGPCSPPGPSSSTSKLTRS